MLAASNNYAGPRPSFRTLTQRCRAGLHPPGQPTVNGTLDLNGLTTRPTAFPGSGAVTSSGTGRHRHAHASRPGGAEQHLRARHPQRQRRRRPDQDRPGRIGPFRATPTRARRSSATARCGSRSVSAATCCRPPRHRDRRWCRCWTSTAAARSSAPSPPARSPTAMRRWLPAPTRWQRQYVADLSGVPIAAARQPRLDRNRQRHATPFPASTPTRAARRSAAAGCSRTFPGSAPPATSSPAAAGLPGGGTESQRQSRRHIGPNGGGLDHQQWHQRHRASANGASSLSLTTGPDGQWARRPWPSSAGPTPR